MNASSSFEYTWKIGFEYASRRGLRTNRPPSENTVLIDLFDGLRYAVWSIFPAGPHDREWAMMPETVLQTWPAGSVSAEELTLLRTKAKYTSSEICRPHEDVIFFLGND